MSSKYDKDTAAPVIVKDLASHIQDKVILTTGVTPNGLGAIFVEQIAAAKPKLLILAGRSTGKLQAEAEVIAKTGVAYKLLELDLSSFDNVKKGAALVNGWQDVPVIDVLVNNAGIMAVDYGVTADGFEKQLATNHLGPFLFTNLIIGKILASKDGRVVSVSSDGHRLSPFRFADYDFHGGESYNRWVSYGQAKTANILFALSLAEKLGSKGLTAVSLHPGVITSTSLSNHLDWEAEEAELRAVDKRLGNFEGWAPFKLKSGEQGVATHVYAAFAPELKSHNGAYLLDSHIADPSQPEETLKPWVTDRGEAQRLWELSEKLVGQKFSY